MKKFDSLKLIACLLLGIFYASTATAQVSGKVADLYMYFHNSNSFGLSPAQEGDTIGNLKWMALTQAPNIRRTGAAIRSTVTGPVSANSLPANIIFRTGATGLLDRMVVTEDGLIGIGTLNPEFNLHTVGNTHTTGDFYGRIHFDDNQTSDDAPDSYIDEAYFELKQRNILGLPAGPGAHGGLLSVAPGATSFDHQLFFGNDGLFTRRWDGNAGSWAGSTWHKILTGEDIHGTENRIAKFTGPNSLGDSQLFDDGTNIGLGTLSPDPAFLVTNGGNTRIDGDLRLDGEADFFENLMVHMNIAAMGAITANGDLSTNSNLSVNSDGDIGNDLTVGNNAVVLNRMSIGTTTMATDYVLSVGGKAIAEELRVALQSSWPDYVFEEGYELPDLCELESYIQTNKHLPGIPSAADVDAQGGVDVGEMQRSLLEKVEELTLIVIEQQKQIELLQSQISQDKH
ncbi:MAG: hypothetical protein R2792_12050 [Saprospiraceae bacterium]|jgi:hypothetical protein